MGPASRRVPRVFVYTERTVDGMGKYCTKKRDQLCHPGSFDSAQDKLHAARRAVEGSRQGFTLMELMVYIAIVGIVVIVAGQAFSNSTKMRVRTQSMLKASEVAENVAALFKQDVAQTGAKSSLETHATDGSDDTFSDVHKAVYMDTTVDNEDLSSFRFVPASPASNANLEQFVMRRVRYGSDGKYQAVEEVTWLLENKVLKRRCVVVDDGAAGTDCAPKGTTGDALNEFTTEMATDVDSFQVLPAIPWHDAAAAAGTDEYLVFPDASGEFRFVSRYDATKKIQPLDIGSAGTSVILKGFASNYQEGTDAEPNPVLEKNFNEAYVFTNTASSAGWQSLCEANPIHFDPGKTYELSFGVYAAPGSEDALKSFIPNKDHMAVGLRNSEGQKISEIDDFAFFPPVDDDAKDIERKMRFSVKNSVNACLAFTFSFYSPVAASAPIVISNLKLRVAESANYTFDKTVTSVATQYKKNVKAFQLRLKVKRNGESGEVTLVVPTPSNGPTD